MLDSGRCRLIQGHGRWLPAGAGSGYRGFRRRAGHEGSLPVQRRPTNARVVPRAPQRSPTMSSRRAEISPASCGASSSRTRVGSATALPIDGHSSAGELAAPHPTKRGWKLKLTLKTDACLRPGSVLRSAETSLRSIGRGTCPENSRGIAAKSQTRGRQARAAICVLAEPMAAAGQPLACGEPPSSEAAALRLRALVQHVRRSVRQNTTSLSPFSRAPGAAPGPGAALGARPMHQRGPPPNLGCRGSPLAKPLQSDIGSLLRKVGKAGNAPRSSKPGPHTLL